MLVVAGVGGLLLVMQVQRVNLGEVGLDQGQGQWDHRVNFGLMQAPPGLSYYWGSVRGFWGVNQVCKHVSKGFERTLWGKWKR